MATPSHIRRLDEALINRIAAGEIIHRPASALKELIENSLDAGATSIRVTVKDGGMKLLQIQDNGCGIRKTDLPILAERFTTSKLSSFSDLSSIATYGFRGEALASMSHVSNLSVITKTRDDSCAWKAIYSDGSLVPAKPGTSAEPRPCAGNDGTTITIENLFFNTPTRLSALRSASEEYARILDVVTKYAVHNSKVSFVCKKAGSSSPDISTPSSPDPVAIIRILYGSTIAKELIPLSKTLPTKETNLEDDGNHSEDIEGRWSFNAHFTNLNYHSKKMIFLLFINHRLVESPRMKRALEGVYTALLPKGALPFVYLSLDLPPAIVDVNVHPTKREVHFLYEEEIISKIASTVQERLGAHGGSSRRFEVQVFRPRRASDEDESADNEAPQKRMQSMATPSRPHVASYHKVRTSEKDRTLDSMFPHLNPSRSNVQESTPTKEARDIPESKCYLASIDTLRKNVDKTKHQQLLDVMEKHIFVGIVDLAKTLSLIQYSTMLYLVNHSALAEELFFQLAVRQFGDLRRMKLAPAPSIRSLIELAVAAEEIEGRTPLSREEIVDKICNILMTRREMLSDYFSMDISEDGLLESLPLLLRDYTPNLDKLPNFLMRLGPQVDWTSELSCFETFIRELAYFYVPGPGDVPQGLNEEEAEKAERWQIEHVLFPVMRKYLTPSKSLLERDVVQVANLPDLYKVFERC
ncbi:DNA mismatch repair protein MutL [Fistulina hepatica ATCC 64428]|uniref:DNA mismatch repair protein MutL n=1 Tax=Fistulina hepatica ATCC 64428 TaxID=1128425 RepID=A0A0D7ADI5_9AGAR|nr:DNA mismatch repair protein MutL [Fistulina hepatica ATCC 64428]